MRESVTVFCYCVTTAYKPCLSHGYVLPLDRYLFDEEIDE